MTQKSINKLLEIGVSNAIINSLIRKYFKGNGHVRIITLVQPLDYQVHLDEMMKRYNELVDDAGQRGEMAFRLAIDWAETFEPPFLDENLFFAIPTDASNVGSKLMKPLKQDLEDLKIKKLPCSDMHPREICNAAAWVPCNSVQ